MRDWVFLYSGRKVSPLALRPDDVSIEDIAAGLRVLRYNGHTALPYCVAQHSVLVSHACDGRDALWGLLHDASEAYLGDIPRPLKHTPEFAAYRAAERRVMAAVCERFDLPLEQPDSVTIADGRMLATEKRDLRGSDLPLDDDPSDPGLEPYVLPVNPWQLESSRIAFLHRFAELTNAIHEVP
jgi:hypothetical protein